jgi:cytochrome oxidase Cu insertion factor (SCO1/SenC/PrrC family)
MSPVARRGLLIFLAGLALIAAAFAFDYWWVGRLGTAENPSVAIGGPFTLVDQNGVVRHDGDFRGKLMLVYFGYTFCPDACPTTLQTMSTALQDLGESAGEVEPLFISVDPERDTVAQMKSYATNFDPRLVALTGTPDETTAAARAYRVYFAKAKSDREADYAVDHSSFIYLMGRDGRYLAHFGPDASAEQMAAAIKKYL